MYVPISANLNWKYYFMGYLLFSIVTMKTCVCATQYDQE